MSSLDITPGVDVLPIGSECPATWRVVCTEDEADGLREALQHEGVRACVADNEVDPAHVLAPTKWRGGRGSEVAGGRGNSERTCAFLAAASEECSLRAAGFGVPRACQLQPFRFVKLPDSEEITVGVDWSWPGVTPVRGSPLTARAEELAELAAREGAVASAPVEVALSRKTALPSWDDLREAERTVVALLQSDLPLSVAVAASAMLPRLAERVLGALKLVRSAADAYPLARYFRDQREGRAPDVQPFRAQVQEVAAQMPDRNVGQRRLADVLAILEGVARGDLAFQVHAQLWKNRWGKRPAVQELERVQFPLDDPQLAAVLRGYLVHVVQRRLLLPFAGLSRGLSFLATLYALCRDRSRAAALATGDERVTVAHLRQVIATLEERLVLHESVHDVLAGRSPLTKALDRAFRPAAYIVSVVRPLEPGTGEAAALRK